MVMTALSTIPPSVLGSVWAQDEVDALPRLSTPAFACVVALILVLWLMARVHAERRVQAHGKGPQTRLGFVRSLAGWEPAYVVFGLLAAVLAAAAWVLR